MSQQRANALVTSLLNAGIISEQQQFAVGEQLRHAFRRGGTIMAMCAAREIAAYSTHSRYAEAINNVAIATPATPSGIIRGRLRIRGLRRVIDTEYPQWSGDFPAWSYSQMVIMSHIKYRQRQR